MKTENKYWWDTDRSNAIALARELRLRRFRARAITRKNYRSYCLIDSVWSDNLSQAVEEMADKGIDPPTFCPSKINRDSPMTKITQEFNIPGKSLREARKRYQKGHLLDPTKRDRITENIAKDIGVKPETLYKMERDQYTMTLWQLEKLAVLYGISLVFDDENNITVEAIE